MRAWNRPARSRTRVRKSTRCSAVKYTVSFFLSHCHSASGPTADTRPKSCPRSTSTITDSCRTSGSADGQEKYSFRFPLNRTSTTSVNSLLAQRTHRKVLLLPTFEEFLDPDLAEMAHMATQGFAQRRGRRFGVGVRPARRLGDDLVDDAED